jgi:hypothetical protein
MEQTEYVLLFLLEDGGLMSSEGSLIALNTFVGMSETPFFVAIHPVTSQKYLINLVKVVSVQEVTRESIRLGPDKIVKPGGRFN